MDLLLTHGYFLYEDSKEPPNTKPYAPLGLLYLSSYLRGKGFDVESYDSTFSSLYELLRTLEIEEPATVGIYADLMTRASALAILKCAVDCGWRVIMGGPDPANYADPYLAAGADVVVSGEGEFAVEAILQGVPLEQVPGLCFRAADGRTINTGPARLLADLDAQPWPDRERVEIDEYLRFWREHHGTGSVSVITARGCPYDCRWCSHPTFGKTHRRRSARAVVDEVEWILNRYHPEQLWFADDVFTIDPGWLEAYSAEMRRRGLHIPFECTTRADHLSPHVAAQLAELGCERVWIGCESGSQRLLDAMERGVTLAQVRDAVGQLKQNGMRAGMFFTWGHEGEDLSDIEATYEQVRACQPDLVFTTISYPTKGTPEVHLDPWQAITDREIRIRGRRTRFYQLADQLLRSETPDEAALVRQRLEAACSEVEA